MQSGNFVLILHTHLPWALHHGVWPHGVDWVSEAVAECYVPLLNVFNDLLNEGIPPRVTLDISPVLCEQLEHEDFKQIFLDYCDDKINKAKKDQIEFKNRDAHLHYMAGWWAEWYSNRKNDFVNKYNKSIIGALKELQDKGAIEIMTCGATHGYFPLLGYDKSVDLQMKLAVENYKKHFGRDPRGTWLPECAYRPSYVWKSLVPVKPFNEPRLRRGVEQIVAKHGIKYFVVDQKLTDNLNPIGVYTDAENTKSISVDNPNFKSQPWNFDKTPLRVYEVSSSEKTEYGTAAAFVRHKDIAMQVWSGEVGYPGEPDYLDFHKKKLESNLRYWRVTDSKLDMMYKAQYHPDWIAKKISLQAHHFIHNMENTVNHFKNITGKQACLCVPFDTELFGHWWFEGPEFLRAVIKGLHQSPWLRSRTATEHLLADQPKEIVSIPEGSWGENNNHDVWSNAENVWTWQALYDDELKLNNLVYKFPKDKRDSKLELIITQALRELLLLQSSDWQFLIHNKSAQDYAEQRFMFHHSDFNKMCDLAEYYAINNSLTEEDEAYLNETITRNCPFPELNLDWWSD